VWKLRHALAWRKVAPFIIGSVIGVPIARCCSRTPPGPLPPGGPSALLYSIITWAGRARAGAGRSSADIVVGFLNGLLGGLTGLVGISCRLVQLRGWPKDVQRTVFQRHHQTSP